MKAFPPRIHVLLAREAPVGVVIRRGPSKRVCTVLWDRIRDEFRLGQWLEGRIFERRSDLSPDGRHLIYFALNGLWESRAKGAWTAISRAPYLKAIALFPKGDAWHGGGLFTGNHTYWLNDGHGHTVWKGTNEVSRDDSFQPSVSFGGECPGVYYPRLLRDGWTLVEQRKVAKWQEHVIFEKLLDEGWTLRKIAHAQLDSPAGKGCYWDEHELAHFASDRRVPCPDWEWADRDGNRLVWAENGKLFAALLTREGLTQVIALHDFDNMTFEAIKAPY